MDEPSRSEVLCADVSVFMHNHMRQSSAGKEEIRRHGEFNGVLLMSCGI